MDEASAIVVLSAEGKFTGKIAALEDVITKSHSYGTVDLWLFHEMSASISSTKINAIVTAGHSSLSLAILTAATRHNLTLTEKSLEHLFRKKSPRAAHGSGCEYVDVFLVTVAGESRPAAMDWSSINMISNATHSFYADELKNILDARTPNKSGGELQVLRSLREMLEDYKPVDLTANPLTLSEGDQKALAKLISAAGILNRLFSYQMFADNQRLAEHLKEKAQTSPDGMDALFYSVYQQNKSPWVVLNHFAAFLSSANAPVLDIPQQSGDTLSVRLAIPSQKPEGVNFYPQDMTKEEFNYWLETQPNEVQDLAQGYFTVVQRDPTTRELTVVPYSEAYREWLVPASNLLRDASDEAESSSLKEFLRLRAEAFLSNDYMESDFAWLDLDSPIDVTIGPYETYKDDIFGAKAAFEVFIGLRDDEETGKLKAIGKSLQELENNLPMAQEHKNPNVGSAAPIRVMQLVCAGGDVAGPQTLAFNLPNDERVVKKRGTAQVLIKNTSEAKFEHILLPMAAPTITEEQRSLVQFDAFFTHTLCHELVHGIGPHTIHVHGRETTVRACHEELHSALEEAKADIVGLWATHYLVRKGVLSSSLEKSMYVTFLAGCFRSVRFGVKEAHGKGQALIFNYLLEQGGFRMDQASKKFSVDFGSIEDAVLALGKEILHIQAVGDKKAAKALLDIYGVIPAGSGLEAALARIKNEKIPVDIFPSYPLQELLDA